MCLKYVNVVSVLLQIAIGRELGLDLIAKVFQRSPEVADVWECPLNTFEHVKHFNRLIQCRNDWKKNRNFIPWETSWARYRISVEGFVLSGLPWQHSLPVVRAKRESDNLRVTQMQEIPHQCALAGSGAAPGKWFSCRSPYLSLRKMEEWNCSDWRDNTLPGLPDSQPGRGCRHTQLPAGQLGKLKAHPGC